MGYGVKLTFIWKFGVLKTMNGKMGEVDTMVEDILGKSTIFRDESKLDAAYVPQYLPHREAELKNLVESLVVLAPPGARTIGVEDLPANYREAPPAAQVYPSPTAPARTMEEIEREAIERTLEKTGGNRTRAAEILGIGLRTLQRKLREYGQVGGED